MLLQEIYRNDPWKLLVCCILLNVTSRTQVDTVVPKLFERYPSALDMSEADPEELYDRIKRLGFGRQRAEKLIALSEIWYWERDGSSTPDEDWVSRLPGVGAYALDSYRIFILNDSSRFVSNDKELAVYLEMTAK